MFQHNAHVVGFLAMMLFCNDRAATTKTNKNSISGAFVILQCGTTETFTEKKN